MKRKIVLATLLLILTFLKPSGINSQVDELVEGCMANISSPFIRGDRSMKAFLTGNDVAEFRATFFSGNIYRVVFCSFDPGLIEFTILDTNRNLLFTSSNHDYPGYWDFKIEGSMECIIEARLNTEVAESGVVMLLIGFTSTLNN